MGTDLETKVYAFEQPGPKLETQLNTVVDHGTTKEFMGW